MRLTSDVQREAVRRGSPSRWQGARETGVMGSTMTALQRRGLAELRIRTRRGRVLPPGEGDTRGNVMVYRLTPAGVAAQRQLKPLDEWDEDELVAGFIDGTLSLDDYTAERERRGRDHGYGPPYVKNAYNPVAEEVDEDG